MQFADWAPIYEKHASIPNVARFYEQAEAFNQLLVTAAPDAEQQKDLDFLLNVGHLFSLIVYGQLILEQAALTGVDDDIIDQIFDLQIRDFSTYAVALHGKPSVRSESRCPTPHDSDGCGSASGPTTAPTRCVPKTEVASGEIGEFGG